MVKLRQNHNKVRGSTNFVRFVIYAIILLSLLGYGIHKIGSSNFIIDKGLKSAYEKEIFYLPQGKNHEVIHHQAYTLSYLEEHEQAEWVAYLLTKDMLQIPNVVRADEFLPDNMVSTNSAVHSDYTRSGYTRGHLVPAGDMAHDDNVMKESFFMSNISPQKRAFNNGIWKELEENIRYWAKDKGELIIITGPVLNNIVKKIGKNRVSVPHAFYKIVMDVKNEEMIGYIIPNEVSEEPLEYYMVPVDSIEKVTEIDFFNGYLNDDLEERLESNINSSIWSHSKSKFEERIRHWNFQ